MRSSKVLVLGEACQCQGSRAFTWSFTRRATGTTEMKNLDLDLDSSDSKAGRARIMIPTMLYRIVSARRQPTNKRDNPARRSEMSARSFQTEFEVFQWRVVGRSTMAIRAVSKIRPNRTTGITPPPSTKRCVCVCAHELIDRINRLQRTKLRDSSPFRENSSSFIIRSEARPVPLRGSVLFRRVSLSQGEIRARSKPSFLATAAKGSPELPGPVKGTQSKYVVVKPGARRNDTRRT